MNSSVTAGFSGKGFANTYDLIVGWTVVVLCVLQLLFGAGTLWILKKVNIFHNAFGFLCAARTIAEMLSSLVHLLYSGPMTITQSTAISPYFGVLAGFLGYSLAALSCSLHVVLSLNRFLAVYFPLRYHILFTLQNCRRLIVADVVACAVLILPYYIVPCNVVGYSAAYIGYVVFDCADGVTKRPFRVGTFIHYACWAIFCTGAIVVDGLTLLKILKLNKIHSNGKDRMFKRNVRFFAQSAIQNIPMSVEIALLALGNNELTADKAVFRILSFTSTRLTDVISSTTLVLFNPEVRSFLHKALQDGILVAVSKSSTSLA